MNENILMSLNMIEALIHWKAKEGDAASIYLLTILGEEQRKFEKSKDLKVLKLHKKLIEGANETFTNALKNWKKLED